MRRISKLAEMASTQTEQFGELEENLAHVHTRTIDAIAREHKKLSATELKVCALLLQDLSSKEIAGLIDVEVSSVGKYRQRIRKKLNLHGG